jgi:CubicO group peptidase (beta-lactamase class C family)
MHNKSIVGLLCFLVIAACGGKDTSASRTNSGHSQINGFINQIEPIVKDYEDLGIFSGVVLVAEKGNPLFHKAYGIADRSHGKPNTLSTLFDIGSMNKTFTRIVIKQLEEEGKLALTEHLADYVSGFSDPRVKDVTIDHLLEHRSGFGDYHGPMYFELPIEERSLNAIVERSKEDRLLFAPGESDSYSNLGYVLLGKIIEVASGTSYFKNVQERIVDKLELKNTYLHNFNGLEDRIATGYFFSPLGILEENSPIQDIPNPDGGFLSTTEDIQKFYHSYFYDTTLLSQASKDADPYFQFLKNLPAGKAASAAGGFEGFNSVILQVLDKDLSIIVFANMDEPVAERIGLDILALYRGETPEKPSLPAIQNVRINFEKNGIEYIRKNFDSLTVNFHPTDPKDLILNDLGYAYLYGANDPEKASAIFALNTELFPEVANCWDSYGEALRAKGDKKGAISSYTKALELQPQLMTAKEALKELRK